MPEETYTLDLEPGRNSESMESLNTVDSLLKGGYSDDESATWKRARFSDESSNAVECQSDSICVSRSAAGKPCKSAYDSHEVVFSILPISRVHWLISKVASLIVYFLGSNFDCSIFV